MTDLEPKKVRDLHLYVRPLEGEIMEVLVFDNELPIYHTTVYDVALRKSPEWKEMFSIKNIKKVMNDQDVIVTKGKESLKRMHANALALLDLSYTGDDLALLVEDARRGLEKKSLEQIQESLNLFFELLDFQPVSLGILEHDLQVFARPKTNGGAATTFENILFFNEESFTLGLKKGTLSPQSDLDLAWVMQYARGEEKADLEGAEVLEFLAALALKEKP
jgi:SpoVK/Ycf46/Vps4 family AAA+-type ATPase